MTFHIPDTPSNRDAWEALRRMAEESEKESVLYGEVDGLVWPIAYVRRHEECPKDIYDKIIKQILK